MSPLMYPMIVTYLATILPISITNGCFVVMFLGNVCLREESRAC